MLASRRVVRIARSAFTLTKTWQPTIHVGCAMRVRTKMSGKLEMFDVGKWNGQAMDHVRLRLEKAAAKGLPCAGHCLVYMDHQGDHIDWKFETHLAFDPENPPSQEERDKLEKIFDGYARMCQKLMDGGDRRDQ